jgi:hypothetical protein
MRFGKTGMDVRKKDEDVGNAEPRQEEIFRS